MRRIDRAMVAGYYSSDSAGTFATCVAVLTGLGIAFDAYMPVMLAVMEIPGCLVALYLVARLRNQGMDPAGPCRMRPATCDRRRRRRARYSPRRRGRTRGSLGARENYLERTPPGDGVHQSSKPDCSTRLAQPPHLPLVGAIFIGFISGLQGGKVIHYDNALFVGLPRGAVSVPARNGHRCLA